MKDSGWSRAGEALGVGRSRDSQGDGAFGRFGCCQAVVHVSWGVQADADVPVLMVVPLDEGVQEASSIGEAAEAFGEGRGVLQRLKPGLGVIPNSG